VLCFDDLGGSDNADQRTFEVSLLRLAGEAGDLAKRFAEGAYQHNVDALRGDLVKLLRPLVRAANAEAVSLEEAALHNMDKTEDRWPTNRQFQIPKDEGLHIDEQLPRNMRILIYEREVNGTKFVLQKWAACLWAIGSPIITCLQTTTASMTSFTSHTLQCSDGRRQRARS